MSNLSRSALRPFSVAAGVLVLSVGASLQEPATSGTLAFLNITVIDGTGAPPRPDQTVVVSDGRIAAAGDSDRVSVPAGAQSIDATGQFMIPGLWDLHVHTRYEGIDHLRLLLVHGVTTARDMAGPWNHLTQIKRWRDEIASGERVGPRLLTAGPLLDGSGSHWSHAAIVASPEEGRRTVRRLRAEGVDFVKVYGLLSRESFFAIADEAGNVGLPFVGHVPNALSVLEVSNAGQQSIEHLDAILVASSDREEELRNEEGNRIGDLGRARMMVESFSPSKLEDLAVQLRRNGTSVVPTLSNSWTRLGWARQDKRVIEADSLRYIPEAYRRAWLQRQAPSAELGAILFERGTEAVRLLRAHGVSLLAGTDVVKPFFVPGVSLHDELRLLVEAGLTEMEALQTATRDPARFVGLNEVGTIERGMVADLLVLDADPLESIDNTRAIAAVVSAGRLLDRSARQRMLSEIAESAATWPGVPTGS